MSNNKPNYKITFIGDTFVGKTSIMLRIKYDRFNDQENSTIGVSYNKQYNVRDKFNIDLWDTAGQERFRSIAKLYYNGAIVAIVVFDLSEIITYKNAIHWIMLIKNYVENIILVGNKSGCGSSRPVCY